MRSNPPAPSRRPKSAWIIVAVCALSLGHAPAEAANYYVATSGSNANSGTSLASPFLTIQQAASVAQAGDTVYVCGGTYRETVTMPRSGTASAPIAFQPYAGQQVTITGLDALSGGWSTYSGSTYQNTVAGGVSQLFVGGQMMIEARSTHSGYINPLRRTYDTVTSANDLAASSTITSGSLNTPSDGTWTGAKMAIVSGSQWVTFNGSVASQAGNTLNVQWSDTNYYGSPGMDSSYYGPAAGNPFYLYGSLAAVSSPKEYYYDASKSKLYFNSSVDPNRQTVEVRTRQLGFDLGSQSYVNVSGFRFQAANVNVAGSHNRIDNCQILYPQPFGDDGGWNTTSGVTIGGQNNTLCNSEVAYSWGSGVTVTGSSNTVNNNAIHDVNWYGNDASLVDISGSSNSAVTNNTMYNAGRSGLLNRNATGATIAYNDISRYGFLTKDLGGTYCFETDGGGSTIAYNNIHDCYDASSGVGVYLDNGSSNFQVHHNLVTNVSTGALLNTPGANENVYNNTLWNVGSATAGGGLTNCSTYNNLSNNGAWVGSSISNNVSTTADPFNNSAAGDYTLKSGSGIASNVGAFESGVAPWTAGANWKAWTAGNQTAARLAAALYVTQSGTQVTTGSLMVGNTGDMSANSRSFLQFDLSGVVATTIQSAILRIYEDALPASAAGSVTLYRVTSAWTDSNVSYNQSLDTAAPITGFYDPANLDLYTDIDITSWVQSWLNGSLPNDGLCLCGAEGVTGTAKYFDGFYGVTGPELLITLPEPSVLALLATGLLAALAYVWKKRR